jgi:hypothetical protein
MGDPNSNSTQVLTDATIAVIGRWRRILVTLAFIFPIVEMICIWLIQTYPDSWFGGAYLSFLALPRQEMRPLKSGDMIVSVLVFPVLFDWPFFVLAARVKRTFRKHWPDAMAAHAAIIGGLIGLSIPYLFFYAELPMDFLGHSGAGASLFVPVIWFVGGLLAYSGLRIGPVVARKREML